MSARRIPSTAGQLPLEDTAIMFEQEITPEDIINPRPRTPRQAARDAFPSLLEAIGAMTHRWSVWRSLSTTSQRALENVHDAVPCRMAPATRACLIRKGLIQDNGSVTLLGREVVSEARHCDQISRRESCRRRAENPERTARLGLPAGCCTTRYGPITCSCKCHHPRHRGEGRA